MMRKLAQICSLCFIYLTIAFAAERLDGIAAVVGDSVILISEVEAYTLLKINQLGLKPDSLELAMMRHKSLEELVEGKVLLVHAEKDTNLVISSDEIESEVNSRIGYIMKQNNISLKELDEALKKEQGITLPKFKNELRQQIRQEILKQKVQQLYVPARKISRNDVEKFYQHYKDSIPDVGESIRLSKITLSITPSNEVRQKAYNKILSIKEKLNKGEDFIKVSALYSEAPNAADGGDIGYISKGSLNELAFEEKAFSLKPGETSEPFETRLGFHIINVVDRKEQQVRVRQIFVSITPPEKEIQRIMALCDSLGKSCRTKADFAATVKKFSTDEISKSRDGLLEWKTIASLDASIKEAFDTLTVGSVSSPVRDEKNISIYRIEDLAKSRKLTPADDWNELSQIAERIDSQKRLIELVNKWKKQTFIVIRL